MKIPSKINIKKDLHFYIFKQLNELLNWGATPSDIKILAELYNTDFEMINTGNVKTYEDRMAILFSSETKKKIMKYLNMSYNTFNNSLSKLRKKDLVNENNTIDEKRLFNLNLQFFRFTVEFSNEEEYRSLIKKTS